MSWSATAQPSGTIVPMSAVTATRSGDSGPVTGGREKRRGELVGDAGPPDTVYTYATPDSKGLMTAVYIQPRQPNIPAEYVVMFAVEEDILPGAFSAHQTTLGDDAFAGSCRATHVTVMPRRSGPRDR